MHAWADYVRTAAEILAAQPEREPVEIFRTLARVYWAESRSRGCEPLLVLPALGVCMGLAPGIAGAEFEAARFR